VPDAVDQLIEVGRKVVATGLVVGSGGNLSARSPNGDACWITGAGTWLDELDRSAFSLVRIGDGAVLSGHPEPSTEVLLHLRSFQARPDAKVLIHLHPQLSVLLDAMGHRIRLVTTDHAFYVQEVRRVPWYRPGTEDLARAAAAMVADGCNCVILAHHGCSVLADSVELAHKRVLNLEEAARATHAALLLGEEVPECPRPPQVWPAARASAPVSPS